ncbi:NAD(P)H-dependent oxidoreductase subunit E [candidate division KSB1 bacterium]|nr:MAG: NAD(P)H-dependent oxidoreductase subunit E [candidate division KSB1 bacterium]MBC6948512.1 NAD(P)H-dependent oxidoreductase subunit E [candidate division KSB1 bacterium]MCE7940413.1 NAD(P)H-dependent oxidoreductase subunit E [Chlorobi bacterium CHB1]MDL1875579.1 NAD(P)H-dependent oxidoreductase subunit E [Cytophagia bacterium CHB2]
MSLNLSQASLDRIAEVLTHYPAENKRAALLPILHLVQEEKGYIPVEMEEGIAALVGVPVVKVKEVLSFYTWFRQKPVGKYHFQVCRTISCTLRGHREIMTLLEKKLGIKDGETSADGKFTLTAVECLASCETAPMMQLNEKYIDNLTPEKIDEILAGLK